MFTGFNFRIVPSDLCPRPHCYARRVEETPINGSRISRALENCRTFPTCPRLFTPAASALIHVCIWWQCSALRIDEFAGITSLSNTTSLFWSSPAMPKQNAVVDCQEQFACEQRGKRPQRLRPVSGTYESIRPQRTG